MSRPKIPTRVQVDVAIRQAAGSCIFCALCHKPLWPVQARILEHMTPREFLEDKAQADAAENLAWVHKVCADRKTYGSGATVADGDIHKIAKSKRLEEEQKKHRAVVRGEAERKPSRLQSRPFPERKAPWKR